MWAHAAAGPPPPLSVARRRPARPVPSRPASGLGAPRRRPRAPRPFTYRNRFPPPAVPHPGDAGCRSLPGSGGEGAAGGGSGSGRCHPRAGRPASPRPGPAAQPFCAGRCGPAGRGGERARALARRPFPLAATPRSPPREGRGEGSLPGQDGPGRWAEAWPPPLSFPPRRGRARPRPCRGVGGPDIPPPPSTTLWLMSPVPPPGPSPQILLAAVGVYLG